jgi:hypothetical protein
MTTFTVEIKGSEVTGVSVTGPPQEVGEARPRSDVAGRDSWRSRPARRRDGRESQIIHGTKSCLMTLFMLVSLIAMSGPLAAAQIGGPQITPLQWTYTRLVHAPMTKPPYMGGVLHIGWRADQTADYDFDRGRPYGWLSERFPYTVPAHKWLLIVDVAFSSKQIGLRNSYFILSDIVIVQSAPGAFAPRIPLIVPPGVSVNATFINNAPEPQWMGVVVSGFLLDQLPGEDWRDGLRRAIEALAGGAWNRGSLEPKSLDEGGSLGTIPALRFDKLLP